MKRFVPKFSAKMSAFFLVRLVHMLGVFGSGGLNDHAQKTLLCVRVSRKPA